MGDLKLPITIFVVIMGMVGLLFLGIILISNSAASARVVTENVEYLNSIDAAHLIETCLEEGRDYISVTSLDSKSGDIDDVCKFMFPGLSDISARAKVVDLEKKGSDGKDKIWNFGWKEGSDNPSHIIYVNIKDGNEIRVGRLYVQTET